MTRKPDIQPLWQKPKKVFRVVGVGVTKEVFDDWRAFYLKHKKAGYTLETLLVDMIRQFQEYYPLDSEQPLIKPDIKVGRDYHIGFPVGLDTQAKWKDLYFECKKLGWTGETLLVKIMFNFNQSRTPGIITA